MVNGRWGVGKVGLCTLLVLVTVRAWADPLPRPTGVSPADLFAVQQSRPLEGFSAGAGFVTQFSCLPATAMTPRDDRLGQDLLLTASLWGYFQLDVTLPVRFYFGGRTRPDGSWDPRFQAGLDGLRLAGKLALPRLRRGFNDAGLGAALTFGVDLPTAVPGPRETTWRPGVVVDRRWALGHGFRLLLAGDLGAALVQTEAGRLRSTSITYGGAAKFLLIPPWHISVLAGVDGAFSVVPALRHEETHLFGGLQWFGPRCYNVTITGGVRPGEPGGPGGIGWFVGLGFARLWGGECRAQRELDPSTDSESRVTATPRRPRSVPRDVIGTAPATSTPRPRTVPGIQFASFNGDAPSTSPCPPPLERTQREVPESVALGELRILLKRAGVQVPAPGATATLSPANAQRIIATLAKTTPSLVTYGPHKVVLHLMREVVAGGKSVPLGTVARHVRRFKPLVVVRPDGYLVGALDGRAFQRAGRIQVEGGAIRAGGLEVGAFYFKYLGNLFRVDGNLQCIGDIEGELALEHGLGAVDSVLDGAEDALGGTAAGMAQLIREPVRSLQALQQLPGAVAALIENSPEYWQRFRTLPANDQIREVSRIVSNLLLLYGNATATTTRLTAAAGKLGNLTVQALRLTASRELALATVSVPVGQIATALSGGPGAVYILHMANTSLPKDGGGKGDEVAADRTSAKEPSALATQGNAATAKQFIALDTNAIIAAVERGKAVEILAGRAPLIPITAAKEYLRRGSPSALREFLTRTGGRLAAPGVKGTAAELRALAQSLGRALGVGDSQIAASVAREGVTIVTNDARFAKFLREVGFIVEGF